VVDRKSIMSYGYLMQFHKSINQATLSDVDKAQCRAFYSTRANCANMQPNAEHSTPPGCDEANA